MKTARRLALVVLPLSLVSPGGLGAAQENPPPRVEAAEPIHDGGAVGVGEAAVHEFLVRNAGGTALKLSLAEASPGAAVSLDPAEIAPGGEGRVRVVVDTERRGGKLELRVLLQTNDPERPHLALDLRLEVRAFLQVNPGYARYITVQGAREGTIAQTVAATDGAQFRVLKAESPVPHLRVAFRETRPEERRPGQAGSQWRVETTLASDAPVGAVAASLLIETDHPKQHRVSVPMSGFVRPIFAVTPPQARLGDLDPARPEIRRLLVKNFAEEPIDLTSVATTVPGVRAELVAVEPGRTWHIQLRLAEDVRPGAFEGVIRIATASPKVPLLEVPLSGRIGPASSGREE